MECNIGGIEAAFRAAHRGRPAAADPATDPDTPRTAVTCDIQASFDGGANWRVVEQTREKSVLVSCSLLQGGQASGCG